MMKLNCQGMQRFIVSGPFASTIPSVESVASITQSINCRFPLPNTRRKVQGNGTKNGLRLLMAYRLASTDTPSNCSFLSTFSSTPRLTFGCQGTMLVTPVGQNTHHGSEKGRTTSAAGGAIVLITRPSILYTDNMLKIKLLLCIKFLVGHFTI